MVLYVLLDEDENVAGLLKLGNKQLFLVDREGQELRQVNCVCVLDFYVKHQRQGLGKILFDEMLRKEDKYPGDFALDRPSGKFLGFMRKHYGLKNFRHQANKFLVFDEFWTPQSIQAAVVAGDEGKKEEDETLNGRSTASSSTESRGERADSTRRLQPILPDFRRKRIPYN
jgi:alpha-tubulin N-acetyltransferase 1